MLDAMAAKRAEQAEDRKLNPKKYTRQGVPDGWRRPEAEKAWAAARVAADAIMNGLKASGAMPAVVVPDSDDEKAELALREACVIALGPCDKRSKLMAANLVLTYTMPKPAQHIVRDIVTAEGWLRSLAPEAAV